MSTGTKATKKDFSVYAARRKKLVSRIAEQYGDQKNGIVVLFAGLESDSDTFLQESSFYYYTGITEPGTAIVIDLTGASYLYVPDCMEERVKWMRYETAFAPKNAAAFGFDEIRYLGDRLSGFQVYPFSPMTIYRNLIDVMVRAAKAEASLFVLSPDEPDKYIEQRLLLGRLCNEGGLAASNLVDISSIVAGMRRRKDQSEIELMYGAVEITSLAHEAAAQAIEHGVTEAEVQASLEYMFIGSHARPAFASIVGSGKNSTVLHYHENDATLQSGDLVVVDIGARHKQYCADITRTYPVSGRFTARQKEIYEIVLETQEYIANLARPGMWLTNKDCPEQSLNHLAKVFLKDKGYEKYFPHGIGHFLGLDVHDVGDRNISLQEGDVITIEPGIYIPEEKLGVRIEDNYWIVKDGAVCLSEHIPKAVHEVEAWMRGEEVVREEEEDELDSDEYDG